MWQVNMHGMKIVILASVCMQLVSSHMSGATRMCQLRQRGNHDFASFVPLACSATRNVMQWWFISAQFKTIYMKHTMHMYWEMTSLSYVEYLHWAAQHKTWLLFELRPKGILFAFSLISFS